MGIERKVEEKWVCDNCGKEIATSADAVILETNVRKRGMHIGNRDIKVFCNKDCANTWWKSYDKKKDTDLIT